MSWLKTGFGKRLRQVRRERKLTQEQLAEAVGISVVALSNIERGVNGPEFETLEKLIEVLEVSPHELFLFSHEANPPAEVDDAAG
jgi:transcriptional regulator with XRE-family HTH domain